VVIWALRAAKVWNMEGTTRDLGSKLRGIFAA
jgi:hypothetical protein